LKEKERYTLGKNERLKSRKDIEQLFAAGRSFSVFPFKVIYLNSTPAQAPRLQAAFSVSKRHFKKATQRNRIKRLMREAYRLQATEIKELAIANKLQLQVFIIYTGNEIPVFELVKEKMAHIIHRIKKMAHEKTDANT
jgi:ribonuclease P protein component